VDTIAERKFSPSKLNELVIVGKDVLELLSSAMYTDPLTIYREYIQNAVDAIDEAESEGLYKNGARARITILIDCGERTIRISDNGAGVPANSFARRLTAIGGSRKRGSNARGFRGVGRLCGLAYCEELIFRSKSSMAPRVWEVRFDCRRLKDLLNDSEFRGDVNDVMYETVKFETFEDPRRRSHFFEVELRQTSRVGNDVLLNQAAVRNYISQVAPLPFTTGFRFAGRIGAHLAKHHAGKTYNIYLNDEGHRVERPFTNSFAVKETRRDQFSEVQCFEVPGLDGSIDAVGWILHHSYQGTLPEHLGIEGLRLRLGNIQVGDSRVFASVFPEPRFNGWTVGEVHIVSKRLVPNGRRDQLEENIHKQNLLNHLISRGRAIAKLCRDKSAQRSKRIRTIAPADARRRDRAAMKWSRSVHIAHYTPRSPKEHRVAYRRVLLVLAQIYGVPIAARMAKLLLPRLEAPSTSR
jgi:Histidine kinase-, DNA gyrase B-, and HSP90-like ATPase